MVRGLDKRVWLQNVALSHGSVLPQVTKRTATEVGDRCRWSRALAPSTAMAVR